MSDSIWLTNAPSCPFAALVLSRSIEARAFDSLLIRELASPLPITSELTNSSISSINTCTCSSGVCVEPEHNFFYKLATDCKSFKYKLTVPKGYDVKNRILRVDTELGYKWMAKPSPIMKIKDGKTIITWEGKNLKAHQAFRFEW